MGLSPSVTAKGTKARARPSGREPPCLLRFLRRPSSHHFPLVATPSLPVGLLEFAPHQFGKSNEVILGTPSHAPSPFLVATGPFLLMPGSLGL